MHRSGAAFQIITTGDITMKKIISIILTLVCALSLASCGGTESNRLEKTAAEIAKTLPEKIDLNDLDVFTNEDQTAQNILFIYGIDEDVEATLDSYFITNAHRSTDPRAIVVLFFKDAENVKDNIAAAKSGMEEIFLANLRNTTATYDPEAAKIVNAATFKEYDNALVMASFDTNGNTAVFDAIEGK